MKAVYHSQYRKPGTRALMFTYVITGTRQEIDDYILVQEAATGRAAGTWPKDEVTGAPLWWLNTDIEKRNGNMPKQSYTLIFNRDKTRIIRDDSAEQMAAFTRINKIKEEKLAILQAEIELGLRVVDTSASNTRITTTLTGPAIQMPEGDKERKSLADEIVAGIGDGNSEGENEGD